MKINNFSLFSTAQWRLSDQLLKSLIVRLRLRLSRFIIAGFACFLLLSVERSAAARLCEEALADVAICKHYILSILAPNALSLSSILSYPLSI